MCAKKRGRKLAVSLRNQVNAVNWRAGRQFLSERRDDIRAIMSWPDLRQTQARLLLKMMYDLELMLAAIFYLRRDRVDIKATAAERAKDNDFMQKYDLSEADWQKVLSDPIRVYDSRFIRRRLMIPNDPDYFVVESESRQLPALSTIKPGAAKTEARRHLLMTWGKRQVDAVHRDLAERDVLTKEVVKFLKGKSEFKSPTAIAKAFHRGKGTVDKILEALKDSEKA